MLDLHAREREDIGRLRALAPHTAEHIEVAIHPESGRLGLFVVGSDLCEIDLHKGGSSPADPTLRAQQVAHVLSGQMAGGLDIARALLDKLESGTELSYEEVYGSLPPSVPPEVLRGALRQARNEPLEVVVNGEERRLGGYSNIPKEVSSRSSYGVLVDVREIDRDGRPNGTVTLKVLSGLDPVNPLPLDLPIGRTVEAHLRTTNNQRSLALLHLPGVYEVSAKVKLGICSNLATGKVAFFVDEVDVGELLQQARPIQEVLDV